MIELLIQPIFYTIETIGIVSFALSGVILAKQKNFDLVGVYVIAWVTAFGGGTLRDVILDRQPVYWISHAEYPLMLLGMVLVIEVFKRINIQSRWLIIPDAIGLATFAITTAQMTYEMGLPVIIIGIMATVVATFGGVLRDILCQEVPIIFKQNSTMYASLAFLGACLYVALNQFTSLSEFVIMVTSICFIFLCRLIAYRFNISVRLS